MRIFGLEVGRAPAESKAATSQVATVEPVTGVVETAAEQKSLLSPLRHFFGAIREPFAGAWQKNVQCDSKANILAFSAVYACVSLIADDISKLRIELKQMVGGIWTLLDKPSAFHPVLRKPNRYQTQQQFLSQWMVSKLLYGNAYVLKERDARGVVVHLYVLDPRRVTPLVAPDGDVFYQLSQDELAGVEQQVTIPAAEIIHDRMICLWHPLVGVSPIYACGSSATQGIRIQANSAQFFENMSRPSGVLTAPSTIDDVTAARLKAEFETNYGGANLGRLLIGGDGLKYEAMTIPANDAQLIEQLKWTVEDVARCFHVPLYKVMSGANPTFSNAAAMNQDYYSQTLQILIEAIEALLDEGLRLPADYCTEFDLDGLIRMDPLTQADVAAKGIGAGYLAPNEARRRANLGPVAGGDTPYMQQQQYSLAALDARDRNDPFAKPPPPATVAPDPAEEAEPTDAELEELAANASLILTKELGHAQHA